jgi:hypothetical protein
VTAPDSPAHVEQVFRELTRGVEREIEQAHCRPAVITPCPVWCASRYGCRDFEVDAAGVYERRHVAFTGKVACIEVAEHHYPDGTAVLDAPVLDLYGDDLKGAATVDQALALEIEMRKTVEVMKRLSRAEAPNDTM